MKQERPHRDKGNADSTILTDVRQWTLRKLSAAILVDTQNGTVEGRWGVDSCSKWVDSDAIDELNEAIEELIETR